VTTIDEGLLKKAQEEAGRVAEAERQLLVARGEYHSAVRRLHLAGASLREVAEALRISHQRVQQIVGAAGGTWWQRAWSSRNRQRAAVCTFCERPPSEVAKLIAGPNVFICDSCTTSAEAVLAGARGAGLSHGHGRCSFCGSRHSRTRAVVGDAAAKVCQECVRACRGILDASTE
jgi:hypothetical protein